MSWKPDFSPIAKAVAELINSKPRSPSLEELQRLLHKCYLDLILESEVRVCPIEMFHDVIDQIVSKRAEGLRVLINSKPRSPTIAEIMNVLCPPRPEDSKVYSWEGKLVTGAELRRLHEEDCRIEEEARRIALDQHLEECACERCLEDLETAYRRSAAYYVRYLERIEYEPHPEYPEAELWVLARSMAAAAAPIVVW